MASRDPQSLEEIQAEVAKRITELPPEMQANVMAVVIYAYRAGINDCKRMFAEAGAALRRGINGL